jgi:hypothetical protein
VLNIDTMIEIICNYLNNKDWVTTLENAVPLRRKIQGGKTSRKKISLQDNNNEDNNNVVNDRVGNDTLDTNVLIVDKIMDNDKNISLNDMKLN